MTELRYERVPRLGKTAVYRATLGMLVAETEDKADGSTDWRVGKQSNRQGFKWFASGRSGSSALAKRLAAAVLDTVRDFERLTQAEPNERVLYRLVYALKGDAMVRADDGCHACEPWAVPCRVTERYPDAIFAAIVPVTKTAQSIGIIRQVLEHDRRARLVLDEVGTA